MSITPVPISIRLVLAPMGEERKGEDSWRAKWCTRVRAVGPELFCRDRELDGLQQCVGGRAGLRLR